MLSQILFILCCRSINRKFTTQTAGYRLTNLYTIVCTINNLSPNFMCNHRGSMLSLLSALLLAFLGHKEEEASIALYVLPLCSSPLCILLLPLCLALFAIPPLLLAQFSGCSALFVYCLLSSFSARPLFVSFSILLPFLSHSRCSIALYALNFITTESSTSFLSLFFAL